jgi:16S rRNA (guanine(966)-N(2))-methyltransferase RsmD
MKSLRDARGESTGNPDTRQAMRILGGTARGMALVPVKGMATRPALARVRNSLFNILAPRLDGARILDLFAGTGSLGIETLSRGAACAVFVDADRWCIEAIRKSLEKMRLTDRGEVVCGDVFRSAWKPSHDANPDAPRPARPFDIVFIDPPYAFYTVPPQADRMAALVEEILRSDLSADGRVILEHRRKAGLIREPEGGRLADRREYGQTILSFYAKE